MPDGDVNHATHRCDAFLTNEVRLKQVDAVCVLVLDDLAEEVPRDRPPCRGQSCEGVTSLKKGR